MSLSHGYVSNKLTSNILFWCYGEICQYFLDLIWTRYVKREVRSNADMPYLWTKRWERLYTLLSIGMCNTTSSINSLKKVLFFVVQHDVSLFVLFSYFEPTTVAFECQNQKLLESTAQPFYVSSIIYSS